MIYTDDYWEEMFQERAAIIEEGDKCSRKDAERRARNWVAIERIRVATEQAESRRQATTKKQTETKPTHQQETLPGFEEAYRGG